jgi:hypothetical protein
VQKESKETKEAKENNEASFEKFQLNYPWPRGKKILLKLYSTTTLFFVSSWDELNHFLEKCAKNKPKEKVAWSEGPGTWTSQWFNNVEDLRAHLFATLSHTLPARAPSPMMQLNNHFRKFGDTDDVLIKSLF